MSAIVRIPATAKATAQNAGNAIAMLKTPTPTTGAVSVCLTGFHTRTPSLKVSATARGCAYQEHEMKLKVVEAGIARDMELAPTTANATHGAQQSPEASPVDGQASTANLHVIKPLMSCAVAMAHV